MDRGRVGYNSIGNKVIRTRMIADKQAEHMRRLNKIRHRKPGTSETIDCTPPEAIEQAKNNPRKSAFRVETSLLVEKENKALLQRISNVLTAPPKIDDKDYLRMKKILNTLKSTAGSYEHKLQQSRTKQLFEDIKNVGPYYNPKVWELEYKRQLVIQKFMRQVTYKRPKNFVDKFTTDSTAEGPRKSEGSPSRPSRMSTATSGSRSHLNVIRAVKTAKNSRITSSSMPNLHHSEDYDEDIDFEYVEDEDESERLDLSEVTRRVRVVDPSLPQESQISEPAKSVDSGETIQADAEIDIRELCAIRGESGVMKTIKTQEDPGLTEGSAETMFEYDFAALRDIGNDITGSVEIRVEEGCPRLVLNVAVTAPSTQEGSVSGGGLEGHHSESSILLRSIHLDSIEKDKEHLGAGEQEIPAELEKFDSLVVKKALDIDIIPENHRVDGRFYRELKGVNVKLSPLLAQRLDDVKMSKKVERTNSPFNSNDPEFAAIKLLYATEMIPCDVTVDNTVEDKITVKVKSLKNSKLSWAYQREIEPVVAPITSNIRKKSMRTSEDISSAVSNQPWILHEGAEFVRTIALPSIMQADYELIEEYCDNLVRNLSIEYDETNWSNSLLLK